MATEGMDAIVAEMYDLTPEQVQFYHRLQGLVAEALEQFDQGYAVDVESEMAALAKTVYPRTA
jgi:hypothetical protein